LKAGDYTLTIRNQQGCQLVLSFTIEECFSRLEDENLPGILIVNGSRTQIEPPTTPKGSIALTVSGGIQASYQFKWTGPNGFSSTQQNINNLDAGNYCVTLTDGCQTVSQCFEIVDCATVGLGVFAQKIENTCYGTSYGSISVSGILISPPYSSSPYSYVWSNGKSGSLITNLSNGEYAVTVTDKNGCKARGAFSVNDSSPIRTGKVPENCLFFDYCNYPQNSVGRVKRGITTYLDPLISGAGAVASCTVTEICTYQGFLESKFIFNRVSKRVPSHDSRNCYTLDYCYSKETRKEYFSGKTTVQPTVGNLPRGSFGCDPTDLVRGYFCADGYLIRTECISVPLKDDNPEVSILSVIENEENAIDINGVEPPLLNLTSGYNEVKELFITNVYPNPFENSVEVVIQTSFPGNIELFIFDVLGNKIMQNEVYIDSFGAGLKLEFNDGFPSGVYQIMIKDEKGNTATHKIVRITK